MKLITCEINGLEKVAVLTEDRVFTLESLGAIPSYDPPGHGFTMTDIIRMWDDELSKNN